LELFVRRIIPLFKLDVFSRCKAVRECAFRKIVIPS
jgi:hypothetical protein